MSLLLRLQIPSTAPVTPRFSYLYNDWSLFPSHTTRFTCYDVYEKMWKYTDDTAYESEFPTPPPVAGLEATGFPTIARRILQQANQLEWVEDD